MLTQPGQLVIGCIPESGGLNTARHGWEGGGLAGAVYGTCAARQGLAACRTLERGLQKRRSGPFFTGFLPHRQAMGLQTRPKLASLGHFFAFRVQSPTGCQLFFGMQRSGPQQVIRLAQYLLFASQVLPHGTT